MLAFDPFYNLPINSGCFDVSLSPISFATWICAAGRFGNFADCRRWSGSDAGEFAQFNLPVSMHGRYSVSKLLITYGSTQSLLGARDKLK
jgi:hypothetical protein